MRPWEEINRFLRIKESDDALSSGEHIRTIDPDAEKNLQKHGNRMTWILKIFKEFDKQLNVTTKNNQPAKILHENNLEYQKIICGR